MHGYSEHVRLSDEELDRIPSILNLKPLWLACLEYRMAVNNGRTPAMNESWMRPGRREFAERLAARAIASLRN